MPGTLSLRQVTILRFSRSLIKAKHPEYPKGIMTKEPMDADYTDWPEEDEPEASQESEDVFDWVISIAIAAFAIGQGAMFFCRTSRDWLALSGIGAFCLVALFIHKKCSVP